MSRWNENKVTQELSRYAETEPVEPPADLLGRLKAQIPADLPAPANAGAPPAQPETGSSGPRRWLIAASLVGMLGAGLVGLQVLRNVPSAEVPIHIEAQAPDAAGGVSPETAQRSVDVPSSATPREMADTRADAEMDVQAAAPVPEEKLESLGYVENLAPQLQTDRSASPPPPAARPYPSAPMPQKRAESESLRRQRVAPPAPVQAYEVGGGVEGGVVGGVVGGVAGGSPGGVVGGAVQDEIAVTTEAARISRSTVLGTTGGNAEPNDEPYGDNFFKSAGVNPFIDTEDDALSTFGLDVDTGSYTVARRYLNDGNLPPGEAIRVEEFLNYFDYRDRPPVRGDFALRIEGAPSPFAQGERYHLVRFGIKGREVEARNRKPAVLTFVVDVSGSMDQENRLGLVKRSLGLLLDELRPSDKVGLVVYGDHARLLLEPTSDKGAVRRAIEELRPEGSTNAAAGLALGYDVASRHFRPGSLNRILLCSDGVANVGLTGADSILARIGQEARRGIELTTLGFGMGNFNDVLMEQLANKGDGRYAYVDEIEEAERVLVEELTGTLQTIAKDAKAQVEFNPAVVARYRLLGYENRDIADERFRDDSVDAGEIGAGHTVTALYEVKLQPDAHPRAELATLRLRYRDPETGKVTEVEQAVRPADLATRWERAPASLRLATLVAEFAEILKGSYWAKDGDLREVLRRAQQLEGDFPGDKKVRDFVGMVEKAVFAKGRRAGE
ncbi:MAG TPA: von Willebrand factor type A domain-containing protein [Thermoanaerobaculia bacterium]|nr:von Willebrand factor type A domain-containing protein [Thermoanaerobaculia bacterium]